MNYRVALLLACAVPCGAYTLPKPDAGFGAFYSPGRCQYANERAYFLNMKAAGFNTFAPQANNLAGDAAKHSAAENIARQVNLAAEVGLLDTRFPVICYSVGPADVVAAKALRRKGLLWPELVVQSIDEPNQTQMTTLQQYWTEAHAAGLRIGTACAGYGATGYNQILPWCKPEDAGKPVPGYGQFLDIWVLLVGTWDETTRAAAQKQGAEVWSYCAYDVTNRDMMRWTYGAWAWLARTRCNLVWAYIGRTPTFDYSCLTETPTGPVDRPRMKGLADGIVDYRVLQAVSKLKSPVAQKWLATVEAQTTLGWWPRGYVATNQDGEHPTVDLAKVRREGLRLLNQ